jgi:L-ectoine synthase
VAAGTELSLQYRHHLEACYLIAGEAELTDLATGEQHALRPGSLYALDQHDRHTLRVQTDLRLVCVFSPALTGREVHDADGGFPPPAD